MIKMTTKQKIVFDAVVKCCGKKNSFSSTNEIYNNITEIKIGRANLSQLLGMFSVYGYLDRYPTKNILVRVALSADEIKAIVVSDDRQAEKMPTPSKPRITREQLARRYKGRRYEDHDFKSKPERLNPYIPSREVYGLLSTSAAALVMEG